MKILILGGDGFCGWPTALHLAGAGHTVVIADNLMRRQIDTELGLLSLTPIASAGDRESAAKLHVGDVTYRPADLTSYKEVHALVGSFRPDTIVHFAEIRSAPYSMKSSVHRKATVDNNIGVTSNVLNAIVDLDQNIHLIHLGTMGVYGYSTSPMSLPEGYTPATIHGVHPDTGAPVDHYVDRMLYPANPGSVYHMTKVMDHTMFQFYAKNWQLKITDLHQGIVYGVETKETRVSANLSNRFDYDSAYGTVLNRFLVQAAMGHPLTVYGTGGQTRAFIHVTDTANCIRLAAVNPPDRTSQVQVFNQVAETHSVQDLAAMVSSLFGASVKPILNPRNEAAENSLRVSNKGLLELGLTPILLEDSLMQEVHRMVVPNLGRVDKTKILPTEFW